MTDHYTVYLLALIIGYSAGGTACKPFLHILRSGGAVRPNYSGQNIPVGGGAVFFFALLPVVLISVIVFPEYMRQARIMSFIFVTALTTLVGIIDDTLGSRKVSGLKGHFRRLLGGELTTGGLKAIAIGIGSLFVFLPGSPLWESVFNAILTALTVNTLNLFDLRPGRAGKVFLAVAAALTAAAWGRSEVFLLLAVSGALIAFLRVDLRAEAMMGDAGSNTLGAAIGLTAAWTLGLEARAVVFLLLLFLNLLAERYSLTVIIANNRVLNFIDRLGRRE
ncbi:MAG: hypothetical protein AB1500_04195 [Bacillota bacterium]